MSIIPVGLASGVRNLYAKTSFMAKANAPLIFRVAHIGLGVATVVLACVATSKLPEIMDEAEKQKEDLEEVIIKAENGELTYTDEQIAKEKRAIKAHTAWKVFKAYAPALATGAGSLGCYYGEIKAFTGTITSLTAAYAAKSAEAEEKSKALEDLRRQLDIPAGTDTEEKAGEEKEDIDKALSQVVIPPAAFAVLFDESCDNYSKAPGANALFFDCMELTFNEDLKSRTAPGSPGVITLNEVYKRLGIRDRKTGKILQTDSGQIVGWTKYYNDADNAKYGADGFISFGDLRKETDGSYILVFNVDRLPLVGRGVFHNEKLNNWSEAVANA